MGMVRSMLSGMFAGAIAAFSFALIHAIFISPIWFSLPVLLIAGALCGLCLGWTYGLLFSMPTVRTWVQFNALFVGMFVLLGCVSVLIFEPVTTIAELMILDGPPGFLFKQALPVTIITTFTMAALIGRLYARKWSHYLAILFTCTVLVLLLGLNVSVIGLVLIPRSSIYLIFELAGLILSLNIVFVFAFLILGWKTFFSTPKRLSLYAEKP